MIKIGNVIANYYIALFCLACVVQARIKMENDMMTIKDNN